MLLNHCGSSRALIYLRDSSLKAIKDHGPFKRPLIVRICISITRCILAKSSSKQLTSWFMSIVNRGIDVHISQPPLSF